TSHFTRRRRRNQSAHQFAVIAHGSIVKGWHGSTHRGDAENLGCGGHSGAAFGDTVIKHRGHACCSGRAHDPAGVGPRADQIAQLVVRLENLEDACAPPISAAAATFAATRLVYGLTCSQAKRYVTWIRHERRRGQLSFDLAALTKDSN